MAQTEALSILAGTGGKEKLAELSQGLIEAIQKDALSSQIKNKNYSGDPTTGSVKIARFSNASVDNYGTARSAAKGKQLTNSDIVININQDREIVEEIENKDLQLFGIDGLAERRLKDNSKRVAADLDREFFKVAEAAARKVEVRNTEKAEDAVEAVIQAIETTNNDYVDGVDRDDIVVTLTPAIFGKLRSYIDHVDGNAGEAGINLFHGVRVFSNTRQTKPILAQVEGAVAQLVNIDEYKPDAIPLSNSVAISLFYSHGTKAIMPDLIAYSEYTGKTAPSGG